MKGEITITVFITQGGNCRRCGPAGQIFEDLNQKGGNSFSDFQFVLL